MTRAAAPPRAAAQALLGAVLAGLLAAAADDDVNGLNDRARAALAEGRPHDAVVLLERAHRLDPAQPVITRNLAWACFERGRQHASARRVAEAAADLQRAATLDPDQPGYSLHLGQLHLQRYRLADAETVLRELLRRHPDTHEGWLMLGDVLNLADDLPAAQDAYARAARSKEPGLAAMAREAGERNARQHAVERDYVTDSTPSFVLRYPADAPGPSYGVRLVNVLERARTEVCQALDAYSRTRPTVVLYPPEAFKAATATHDWVGGLFDRKIRLPIADVERDAEAIGAAFRHEFTHLLVSEIDPRCPSLVNEGLAQVMEVGRGHGMTRLVEWLDARPGGRDAVPDVESLPASFMDLADGDQVRLAYLTSYAFMDHVVAHHGASTAVRWVRELADKPLAEAYRSAAGRSLPREQELFRELVARAR